MRPKPAFCKTCVGWNWPPAGQGYVEATGSGRNGVLLVFEAAGEKEAAAGVPLVGKAGFKFNQMLVRGNMEREDFRIHNVLSCRPPDNKLAKTAYAAAAISHCAPLLDRTINEMKPRCIVAGGDIALKRLLPEVPVSITKARGYVFWSERYQTWVIPTVHPSFVMRGQTAWAAVFIHDVQRAVEIARDGYAYIKPDYLLDPTPSQALEWVLEFERAFEADPTLRLSTDIETPDKKDEEEDELDLDTVDRSFIILRCGYSYKDGHGMSLPWGGPYAYLHKRLLAHKCGKIFWNKSFDVPRILAECKLNGAIHDGMVAWHILHSDLKKNLGLVTTFCCPDQPMWKHLSGSNPPYYNCVDADTAGRNTRKIEQLLKEHGLWEVYVRDVIELDPVLSDMTRVGMPIDPEVRAKNARIIDKVRVDTLNAIQEVVPLEAKRLSPKQGYVREPEDKTGLVEILFDAVNVKRCPGCGLENPKTAHFKIYKKKQNPCGGLEAIIVPEGVTRWARIEPFVPSNTQILKYQSVMRHKIIFTGKGEDRKATTNEKAIKQLMNAYPDDPLYGKILHYREVEKLEGTYIGYPHETDPLRVVGGMPVGLDGRIHGVFTHNPSTLRLSIQAPNLQTMPRGTDPRKELQKLVKEMFVAGPGKVFWGVDFSGIEAVLVGIASNSKEYTRLARLGVHAYFASHVLGRPADLSWDDERLLNYFSEVKEAEPWIYDVCKRTVHGSNYRMKPKRMHEEYPDVFRTIKEAAKYQGIYYDLFPVIPAWHKRVCLQVDRTAMIRNAFGYVHRYYSVLNWEKVNGEWDWKYGEDAGRLIAFDPQSNAAGIIKKALKACYYEYPLVRGDLRLAIHDEIFGESDERWVERIVQICTGVMRRELKEFPLDPSWGMGDFLTIRTEAKVGKCWAKMKKMAVA